MDALEPILPRPSPLPDVRPAERSKPVHRDGHGGRGAQGEARHGHDDEEAVEVDVEGVQMDETADPAVSVPALLPAHRIDLTADGEADPPAHRIDLSA